MKTKNQLMYAGLCVTVLTCTMGVHSAFSATATEPVSVTVSNPQPDIILTPIAWTSGTYFAVNNKTTTASITVDPTGTVTPNAAVFPNARLTGSDTVGTPLDVNVGSVTQGAPSAVMSLKIDDATAHTATINVKDANAGDAPFTVTNFVAGTPTGAGGQAVTFTSATGLGTLTLDTTGAADVKFGATLNTVKDTLPKPYTSNAYTGTVEVVLSY